MIMYHKSSGQTCTFRPTLYQYSFKLVVIVVGFELKRIFTESIT